MRIGPYMVYAIETGSCALDGGAMFGVVPKNLWNKTNPADEQNRITLAMRCLLLIHDNGQRILIDNGVGHKYNEKFASIYRIDHSQVTLAKSLSKLDLKTSDIHHMILTHLHFDHAGGSTKLDGNKIVPTFENAKYYVQKKHYEWSDKVSEKDRASFLKDDYEMLFQLGKMNFLDSDQSPFEGIRFFIANGHSPSQQLPIISDGKTTLFFCGDLVPTTTHISIPYVMAYDNQPLVTIEEKKKLMEEAFTKKWILFFEHDPTTQAAYIVRDEKGYRIGDRISL